MDDDYRDPEVLKPYQDQQVTVRVDKGGRKALALKLIATQ